MCAPTTHWQACTTGAGGAENENIKENIHYLSLRVLVVGRYTVWPGRLVGIRICTVSYRLDARSSFWAGGLWRAIMGSHT